jgi:Ras-related protein Rab-6A
MENHFAHAHPTVSVDFLSKTYQIDEFTVRLNIFDTAGQERYRALTQSYLKGTDAVLFMYSMER